MSLLVLLVCLVVVVRRRRRNVNLVVPLAVAVVALTGSLTLSVSLFSSLARVAQALSSVHPSDRAALLAAGISEAVNCFAFELIAEVPLLLVAYVIDRRLRKRARPGATVA
jgi:hypothetical protein